MKGKRHSEEQIIAILKQSEAGMKTSEVCRQNGISEQTFYRWKAKYGGLEASDAKKLRHLEDENRQLKQGGCRANARQPHSPRHQLKSPGSARACRTRAKSSLRKCIRPV